MSDAGIRLLPNTWSGQALPHPAGRLPVLGDVRGFDWGQVVQSLVAKGAGLGPIFEVRIGPQRIVVVCGAELNEQLSDESRFVKHLAPGVASLRFVVQDGLFTAYSDEPNWRLAHDLLRPAFTKAAMRRYHDTMNAVCDELVAAWDTTATPRDAAADYTKVTLETIGRTSFSHSFGSFTRPEGEPDPFVAAMIRTLKLGRRRAFLRLLPGGAAALRRMARREAGNRELIDGLVDRIIAERMARADDTTDDLLGLMLHEAHPDSGARLDPVNVRHQIITFLVAGHETTSWALSFATHFLAVDPALRERAQAEVDAILGPDPDARPAFEDVARLRFVRRVLDESLRLWPTAPAYVRRPVAATTLGRWRMTPDDWALVALPLLHRDPSVWPDPERFDPDRFLPEAVRARPAHAYKPFGTGERACIGRQFALHEAVLVLARVLHRYDIAAEPGYRLAVDERLTLMPRGLLLRPRRRTPASGSAPHVSA